MGRQDDHRSLGIPSGVAGDAQGVDRKGVGEVVTVDRGQQSFVGFGIGDGPRDRVVVPGERLDAGVRRSHGLGVVAPHVGEEPVPGIPER